MAAGALVAYLRETQKSSLAHLTRLTPHRRGATLALDSSITLTNTVTASQKFYRAAMSAAP